MRRPLFLVLGIQNKLGAVGIWRYSPPEYFRRLDSTVFVPLLRSLKLKR